MTGMVLLALIALVSYLVGAIPFGYLFAKAKGVNIFEEGSGNIGATNVGRILGKRFGLFVFFLDFLKGAVPAWLAGRIAPSLQADFLPWTFPVVAGVSAFLGHLFPVYLQFRGGKGVATAAGIVTVLLPLPTLAALLSWFVVVSMTWYVAVASLAAAVVLCAIRLLVTPSPFGPSQVVLTVFCLSIALLVIVRHRSNLARLWSGEESALKDPTIMFTIGKVLHVLAMGLWFGMALFFTFVVGFALFGTFDKVAERPAEKRPLWLPMPEEYNRERPESLAKVLPEPLRKDQGSRAAGHAITPLFDWYFILQKVCAAIAVATALGWSWSRFPQKIHRNRTLVLGVALITVGIGWWLEHKVSDLRVKRNAVTEAWLTSESSEGDEKSVETARSDFGMWHGISVIVNLLTVLLVTIGMVLTAFLPQLPGQQKAGEVPGTA